FQGGSIRRRIARGREGESLASLAPEGCRGGEGAQLYGFFGPHALRSRREGARRCGGPPRRVRYGRNQGQALRGRDTRGPRLEGARRGRPRWPKASGMNPPFNRGDTVLKSF